MIHLQRKIREALQEEFDKNTKGINFDVSLYNTKSNANLTKEYNVENTYHTEQRRYVPVVIQDIFGSYVPIENSTILEGNITSTLLVPTDNEDINETLINEHTENILAALDEIRVNNTGKSIPIGETQFFVPEVQASYDLSLLNGIYMKGRFLANGVFFSFQDEYTFELEKIGNLIVMYLIEGDNTRTAITSLSIGTSLSEVIAFTKVIETAEPTTNIVYCALIVNNKINTASLVRENEYNETSKFNITNKLIVLEKIKVFNAEDITLVMTVPQIKTYIDGMSLIHIKNFGTGENLEQISNYDYQVIGQPFEIGSDGSMQLEFSVPNPTTNVFTYANGLNYQEFMLSWGLTYSDNVFNGNDIKYYIDGVRIYPSHRSSGVASLQNSTQKINANTSRSINEENAISKDFTLYWDNFPKTLELFEEITRLDLEQNRVFKLREEYPLFKREYDVIITEGGFSPTMNTPISVSISLALAEDILE